MRPVRSHREAPACLCCRGCGRIGRDANYRALRAHGFPYRLHRRGMISTSLPGARAGREADIEVLDEHMTPIYGFPE